MNGRFNKREMLVHAWTHAHQTLGISSSQRAESFHALLLPFLSERTPLAKLLDFFEQVPCAQSPTVSLSGCGPVI